MSMSFFFLLVSTMACDWRCSPNVCELWNPRMLRLVEQLMHPEDPQLPNPTSGGQYLHLVFEISKDHSRIVYRATSISYAFSFCLKIKQRQSTAQVLVSPQRTLPAEYFYLTSGFIITKKYVTERYREKETKT